MKLIFLLLCVSYASCFHIDNEPSSKEKIIKGFQVSLISRVPYQTAFEYFGDFACSATLVAEKFAGLPADCINMWSNKDIIQNGQIRGKTLEKEFEGVIFFIVDVKYHPDYESNSLLNNFALLELDKPIMSDENIVDIGISERAVQEGNDVEASGFGSRRNLRITLLKVLSDEQCKRFYNSEETKNYVFCVEKGAERGDMGGPAVIGKKLVGIISNTEAEDYDVITRMSAFSGWIDSIVGR